MTPTATPIGIALLLALGAGVVLPTARHGARPLQAAQPERPQPRSSPIEALALASLPEAVINHRDGRVIRGEILEEDDYAIVVNLAGIRTEVQRSDINTIRRLPPALDRYESLRATLPPDDAEARIALADWLRDRRLFAEAYREVRDALEIDPGNAQARRLEQWLDAQLRMRRVQPTPEEDRPDRDRAESLDLIRDRDARPSPRAALPLLSDDDVNIIRVYEVDFTDPPRMRISRETLEKLYAAYPGSPALPATSEEREQLARRPAHEILDLMFQLKARDLYPEAQIFEDPEALQTFREELHGRTGWLINSCASVRCHGGNDAGWFRLATERAHSTNTVYTNFYILDHTRLPDGTPLIDHDEPEQSPLLQFATRRDNASRPHPPTGADRGPRAWRPVFTSTSDTRFRKAVAWIRSLYRPRPDYGIDYPVPLPPDAAGQSDPHQSDRSSPFSPAEQGTPDPDPANPTTPTPPTPDPTTQDPTTQDPPASDDTTPDDTSSGDTDEPTPDG
ncbi:MAG: hypothetical protein ACF8Q5_12040 [Phycisphaerales bacterium JB040]